MKCPDCKTFKKADNCMRCKIEKISQLKNDINNIIDKPIKDYQKIELIKKLIIV
jgi:hypothetical protein